MTVFDENTSDDHAELTTLCQTMPLPPLYPGDKLTLLASDLEYSTPLGSHRANFWLVRHDDTSIDLYVDNIVFDGEAIEDFERDVTDWSVRLPHARPLADDAFWIADWSEKKGRTEGLINAFGEDGCFRVTGSAIVNNFGSVAWEVTYDPDAAPSDARTFLID